MKKLSALLLSLVMMFTFVACSSSDSSSDKGGEETEATTAAPTPEELAEEAVEAKFEEIRNMDSVDFFEAFAESQDSEDEDSEEPVVLTDAEEEAAAQVVEAVKNPFRYKITSSEKIDDETVEVIVEVTGVNGTVAAEKFYEEFLPYAFAAAFSDPQPTDEEMSINAMKMLASAFEDAGTTTEESVITVILVDGEWVVDEESVDFFDLLCDNFTARMEELGDELVNSMG